LLLSSGHHKYVETIFNTCAPLTDAADINFFKFNVANTLGSADQFDNPPVGKAEPWPLNKTCATFDAAPTPVLGLAAATGGDNAQCNDYSVANYVRSLQHAANPDRAWMWQKCSEFGFFKGTAGSVFAALNVKSASIADYCATIFGVPGLMPDTAAINARYGAMTPNATNVLFTNGLIDPWHLLSISAPVGGVDAVTYAAGHCAPMTAATANDPASLVHARQRVAAFLQTILQ
jgi:hypothetical protein